MNGIRAEATMNGESALLWFDHRERADRKTQMLATVTGDTKTSFAQLCHQGKRNFRTPLLCAISQKDPTVRTAVLWKSGVLILGATTTSLRLV